MIIILVICSLTFIAYRYFIYRSLVGGSPEFTKRKVIFYLFLAFSILFGFGSIFQEAILNLFGISNPNYTKYALIGFTIFTLCSTIITTAKKKNIPVELNNQGGIINVNEGGLNLGGTTIIFQRIFNFPMMVTFILLAIIWFIHINYDNLFPLQNNNDNITEPTNPKNISISNSTIKNIEGEGSAGIELNNFKDSKLEVKIDSNIIDSTKNGGQGIRLNEY